jgi:ribose/xylose/arabinose/galactoside ABC-type transport system permease subunit
MNAPAPTLPRLPLPRSGPARRLLLRLLQALAVAAALAVLAGAVTTQGFFTVDNAKAILSSVSFVGIVAVGMTLIMLSGAFASMSLGTTAAISAMVFVSSLQFGVPVALVLTLALGVAIGAVQGVMIGGWAANPIILTIAAGAVQQGAAVAISQGATIAPPDRAYAFLNETPLGLPVSFYVLLAVVAAGELTLRRTRYGRELRMVGENRDAARAAGLRLGRIGAITFGLACGAAAVAGILLGAFNQGASLLVEGSLTYDAIAATLVGGTAIAGGRGAVWRTLLGAVAIATITDLLLLRGYSTGVQVLVKGLLVLLVVLAVHLRSGERAA